MAHKCASLRFRNSCTRPWGGGGGPALAWRATVERKATAEEVDRYRPEEAIDRIAAAADLGAGAGGQEAEAELAQERQAPLVVGEAGAGLVLGQASGGGAELSPVLAQAVPGLGDDLIQSLTLGQAVVLGPRAVELRLGVEHAPQQVGRQ